MHTLDESVDPNRYEPIAPIMVVEGYHPVEDNARIPEWTFHSVVSAAIFNGPLLDTIPRISFSKRFSWDQGVSSRLARAEIGSELIVQCSALP